MIYIQYILLSFYIQPLKNNRKELYSSHGLYGNNPVYIKTNNVNDKINGSYQYIQSLLYDNKDVVDFGCGTGISTPPGGLGIDKYPAMLAIASQLYPFKSFEYGFAEDWGIDNSVDVVICSFLLHEQKKKNRLGILQNAYRVCRKNVIIIDYDPIGRIINRIDQQEKKYINNYFQNIDREIHNNFRQYIKESVIPGYVIMWNISKI